MIRNFGRIFQGSATKKLFEEVVQRFLNIGIIFQHFVKFMQILATWKYASFLCACGVPVCLVPTFVITVRNMNSKIILYNIDIENHFGLSNYKGK